MQVNPNFQKFKEEYIYVSVRQEMEKFKESHPNADFLDLSIGDVALPIVPSVIDALHQAVDMQANSETFKGYGPKKGYSFLREKIIQNDFNPRNISFEVDEIFISDGSKSDAANIQELFALDTKVAVVDPYYPVYIDSNVMAGRAGDYDEVTKRWTNIIYLEANEGNDFVPNLPKEKVDVIYLNYPNNPTGVALTHVELQKFVDYANENQSLIIYDAAYEAYIQGDEYPHTIYECEGAIDCAIELRSFSKKAGFTGLRLGYMVIPKDLRSEGQSLHQMWQRREPTKFNGASFIIQKAGEAVYSEAGNKELAEQIDNYSKNSVLIKGAFEKLGYKVYGGVHAPYLWIKSLNNQSSWELFHLLMDQFQIVSTPGISYGANGEHFVRLSTFTNKLMTEEVLKRLENAQ